MHDRVDCGGDGLGASGTSMYALELSDGEQSVRLRLNLPLDHDIAVEGDTVRVAYEAGQWGSFHEGPPPEGSLEIRDSEDGLLVWLGQSSHGLEGLHPPAEITVASGADRCLSSSYAGPSCDVTLASLRVGVGGEEVDVSHRGSGVVGDYLALNQENSSGCFSWDPVQVAVVRREQTR